MTQAVQKQHHTAQFWKIRHACKDSWEGRTENQDRNSSNDCNFRHAQAEEAHPGDYLPKQTTTFSSPSTPRTNSILL